MVIFTGVGLIQGDVHLEIDPTVRRCGCRRVDSRLRSKILFEMNKQPCRDGIIEPVANALAKNDIGNGKVRICIDPKPLNKALKWSE